MSTTLRRYAETLLRHSCTRAGVLIDLGVAIALLALAIFLYAQMLPAVRNVTVRSGSVVTTASDLPLFIQSDGNPTLTVRFVIEMPLVAPHQYMLHADDCVSEFRVDDTVIPLSFIGTCVPAKPVAVFLPAVLLAPGKHTVTATLSDSGGMTGFDLRAAPTDTLVVSMQLLIVILATLIFFFIWKLLGLRRWWMLFLVLLGIVLRILYFDVTPHTLRVNDVDGHTAYVEWLLQHRSIPNPNDSWEFFQPPLYYILSAVFAGMAQFLFQTKNAMFWALQFEGLLLSIGVLLAGTWIGNILFPYESDKRKNLTFVALLAVFPTLVISASKINNDGLALLFSFLCIGFLLRYWTTERLCFWYAFIASITLGFLTKFSVITLLPSAYLCLLLSGSLSFRKKCSVGALSLLILAACTEWFYAYSFLVADAFPVANINRLQSNLIVKNVPWNFVGFNADRFVGVPYLLPYDDATGRQFFWEYLIKSSLFGEFDFGKKLFSLAQGMLAVTIFLVPLGLYGFVRDLLSPLRRPFALPLIGIFFFPLAAQIAIRVASPVSCLQDFRYSAPVLVPFFVWQITGFSGYRKPFRIIAFAALWIFIVLAALFMALIPVFRP